MKILVPLIVLAVGLSLASVRAQVPAQPHSLSLKAEPVYGGSKIEISNGTKEGRPAVADRPGDVMNIHNNRTQTNSQSETVQVTVRNFGVLPDSAEVQWYFLAVPVKPDAQTPLNEQERIFDKGSKTENLGPGGTDVFPVTCKNLDSKISEHSQESMGNKGKINRQGNLGRKKETGSTVGGWMIRLVADGRVVDARGSTDALETLARNDFQLRALKGF